MLESMMRAFGMQGSTPDLNTAGNSTPRIIKRLPGRVVGLEAQNLDDEDTYLQMFDEIPITGTIAAITTAGGGAAINIECEAHGLVSNDWVVIEGTAGYDNADLKVPVLVTRVDDDNFTVPVTYGADEAVGTFWSPNIVVGTTAPARSFVLVSGDLFAHGRTPNIPLLTPLKFDNEVVYVVTKEVGGSTTPDSDVVVNIEYLNELL